MTRNSLITRFGSIEYSGDDVLELDGGLVGLPALSRFVLVPARPGSPFSWLQSLDEPSMAFLVTEPDRYVPGYESDVARRCPEMIDAVVLATATVPAGKPSDTTLNLCGPIILDAATGRGRQMVLEDGAYTTRYRVFPHADAHKQMAA